ncbi:MAG: hypothetical protein H0X69_10295 [Gemmatimonadales bacterium]|nr:hypothetical protein [Gemmatimonadales bacterium]
MALEYGRKDEATGAVVLAGMSRQIYEEIDTLLSPLLEEAIDRAPDGSVREVAVRALEAARGSWQKLAYAIAAGVVTHLQANLEVWNAETDTAPTLTVGGRTGTTSGHAHPAGDLTVTLEGFTFR